LARPRPPIAPGDPVWVLVDGQEQAQAGVLVRWAGDEPMKGNGIVQLLNQSAGSHQVYPAELLYYRRDGSYPSDVRPHRPTAPRPPREPETPGPPKASEGPSLPPAISTDPYDQLIDVMGRCADKIDSVIKDAEYELSTAKRKVTSIRKKHLSQLRRIRTAIRLLRGEWGPGKKKT